MATEPWFFVEGVAKDSDYRWMERPGLTAHKTGRLWKFKLSEAEEWVRQGGGDAGYAEQ